MFQLDYRIVVITTGGTIEKSYGEFDGSLSNKGSILEKYTISKLRLPYTSLDIVPVMTKDSLDMTDADREIILQQVKLYERQNFPIVILHGTDTMDLTAKYIYDNLGGSPSLPIILTGAMRPMGFVDSDAQQNFTEALIAAKIIHPGVYISFHNQIFLAKHVKKNRSRGTFEYVD